MIIINHLFFFSGNQNSFYKKTKHKDSAPSSKKKQRYPSSLYLVLLHLNWTTKNCGHTHVVLIVVTSRMYTEMCWTPRQVTTCRTKTSTKSSTKLITTDNQGITDLRTKDTNSKATPRKSPAILTSHLHSNHFARINKFSICRQLIETEATKNC